MTADLRAVTPTGQRIALKAAAFMLVAQYIDDQPVIGRSVLHVPGLPPLVLVGTPDEILEGKPVEPPTEPLVIPSTGTTEV